jgi:dienelactone hydrolase
MRKTLVACGLLLGAATTAQAAGTPREEDVTFRSGAITIAGTLTVPAGTGPFPAVVLLSGSGPQNRDSELLGFRLFKVLADHLAEHGIAALRCDDRGVGGSSGSLPDSTTADFADDALAAVRLLSGRSEIQKTRIGLVGHSEGAIVAAIAASRSPEVGFVVWMAGSAVPGAEILKLQAAALTRAAGAPESVVSDVLLHHAALIAAIEEGASDEKLLTVGRSLIAAQLAALPEAQRKALGDVTVTSERLLNQMLSGLRSPWMRFFIGFDPSTVLRLVSCPVLAVFGGRDLQVPETINRQQLAAALSEARNQDVTVRVYPEANHLFMQAATGQPAEYATLPKAFVTPLLDDITGWIARRSP